MIDSKEVLKKAEVLGVLGTCLEIRRYNQGKLVCKGKERVSALVLVQSGRTPVEGDVFFV